MNRSDFSKPFFMSSPAENNFDRRPNNGGGNGNFRPQEGWNRYNQAYGNYQGGYGMGQGYRNAPYGRPPRPGGMRPPPGGMRPPPGGMRPPPPMMGPRGGGGFGPRHAFHGGGGGPMRPHNPMRFLERCGINPELLKNLPKEVLRLCLAKHCGICQIDFDTFTFARMHYSSKNHQKNQRKWVMNSGGGNPNEEPLKARELYCELCDVQITSKAHADSHYAGKPHAAVVGGRKVPKNAKLLEPSAKARLEQLIRREKRALKVDAGAVAAATAPAPAGEAPAKKEKPPPKAVPPELYCNVCKIGVSCSDQMTTHMNGKKHLSKEKNHILRLMTNPEGVRKKRGPAPWMKEEIFKHMVIKDTLKRKYKRSPTEENCNLYKAARNTSNKMCREAKRIYVKELIGDMDPAEVGKFLKSLGLGEPAVKTEKTGNGESAGGEEADDASIESDTAAGVDGADAGADKVVGMDGEAAEVDDDDVVELDEEVIRLDEEVIRLDDEDDVLDGEDAGEKTGEGMDDSWVHGTGEGWDQPLEKTGV